MDSPVAVLRKYWKHEEFRPLQDEIIRSALDGHDTLVLFPTGGGKSVCFQVPAIMSEGICLVITPLISLMRDQVEQLKRRDILAVAIHSGMPHTEIDTLLDNCVYGTVKFLYVSPERLETELFRERYKRMRVCLVAVDEAHCISQWGYDFRPAYLRIAALRELKPDVPIMALTATADERVQRDIMENLGFRPGAAIFKKSFARENLSFVVRKAADKQKKVLEILQKVRGSAIVYVRSRKATEKIANYLSGKGISALHYHAGLPAARRASIQDEWISDKCRAIVATNAFGMGIDKHDARVVIHFDVPENLESYYQEAGRAGRDGNRAYAVIVYTDADIESARDKIMKSYPPIEMLIRVYQAISNYYQVPEGGAEGESYDFDLYNFSDRFNMGAIEVYNAIKKLEEEGLLLMNESFYRPSRLHFLADTDKLYQFQVANAQYDALIKMLLRLHGGELFSGFATIQETDLAKALQVSIESLNTQLKLLADLRMLTYEPMNDKPQLTFVLARQDSQRLPLDRKRIEARRSLMIKKTDAMSAFIKNEHRCRMQIIQDYFNEVSYAECGLCDVCIGKKKKENTTELKAIRQEVLRALALQALSVEDLEHKVRPTHPDLFIEAIRDLLDEDRIAYDQAWNLRKI